MSLIPMNVYSVFLENGRKIVQYANREPPPQKGEVITLEVKGVRGSYEVVDISFKSISSFETVILKVRPVQL